MQSNFFTGCNYLFRGAKLMLQPGLRRYVLTPLIINIAIFVGFFYSMLLQFNLWIGDIINWLPEFLSFLEWLLWPLVLTLLLAIIAYSFSLVANFIASPFNSLLAEKTEEKLTGIEVSGHETLGQALLGFPKSMAREIHKLVYYLPLALLVLIISFIPGINIISPLLWFLLGSWMMAIQYCDYPMDNNRVRFSDMKKRLKKHGFSSSGFGVVVMTGTMIPIFNLFIMPAAICGACIYWAEALHNEV